MMSQNNKMSDLFKQPNRLPFVPRAGYNKSQTFANASKSNSNNLYLPKTCGFSLPFDQSISVENYLCSVGDIVGDHKIVFAGKNNDLVKIYLPSEADVQQLYDNHPQLVIEGKVLQVKKLVNNDFKIFLCNTEPGMPNSILLQELSKYTKITSPMNFVHLGGIRRFSHVMGFRRTVMVESVDDLPGSFNVCFDNVMYKIFIWIDRVKCPACKGDGHLAMNCSSPKSVQDRLVNTNKDMSKVVTTLPIPIDSGRTLNNFLPAFASGSSCNTGSSNSTSESVTPPPPPPTGEPLPVTTDVPTPDIVVISEPSNATKPVDTTDNNELTDKSVNASDEMEVHDNLTQSQSTTNSTEKCMKRALSHSPTPPSDNDKKQCVVPDESLEVLIPLVIKHDTTNVDAASFVDMISDLKGARNKLAIIREDYFLEPEYVSEIINKLLPEPEVIKFKLGNRLRMLRKAINEKLALEKQPKASVTNKVTVDSDAMSDV